MEPEAQEKPSAGTKEAEDMTDILVVDLDSFVNVELDTETRSSALSNDSRRAASVPQGPCRDGRVRC